MRPEDRTHGALEAGIFAALWQPATPPGLCAPDLDRRFAVYRNTVQTGLIRALATRFPVIEQLVGADFFAAMARVFVCHAPPADPVLLRWGGAFPGFLDGFAPVAHLPFLGDVARIEWARGEAYHAADATPVAPDALRAHDPGRLRLSLHPSVRLVASPHPALQIWQGHQPGARPGPLAPGPDHALIARALDFAVQVTAIDAGDHAVLSAVLRGQSLGQAATLADPTHALTLLLCQGLITDVKSEPSHDPDH